MYFCSFLHLFCLFKRSLKYPDLLYFGKERAGSGNFNEIELVDTCIVGLQATLVVV